MGGSEPRDQSAKQLADSPQTLPRSRRWLAFGLPLAVAAGLLAFLFSNIPLTHVLAAMSTVKVPHLAGVFALSLVMQLVLAERLVLVTGEQCIHVSFGRALEINLSSMFYGLFLPGGNLSRGAVRAYKLARSSSDAQGSLASILFDRLIATVALGLVGQFFWILERLPGTTPVGLAFLATWAVPTGLYLFARHGRLGTLLLPWRGSGLLAGRLTRVGESLRRFSDMRAATLLLILAASVAVHLLSALIYYTLASTLQIEISLLSMAWVSTATTFLTMLPISPSGLGVREGALVYLLGLYGAPGAAALALSLLVFAFNTLLIGLVGGITEARSWLSDSER